MELRASIEETGSVSGFHTYDWEVVHDGAEVVAVEVLGQEGELGRFVAERAGPYEVRVTGHVQGHLCGTSTESVNIADSGVPPMAYRLRFLPGAGHPVPAQERVLEIPGGVPYELGEVELASGVLAGGQISDAMGTPLAGYVRATQGERSAPSTMVEAFADAGGAFSMRVLPGAYDVLVVPEDPGRAPARFPAVSSSGFGLVLEPGVAIAGRVLDPVGAPVVDARVSTTAGDVPSTVATTDGQGAFEVRGRSGSNATLDVQPGPGSGLPRLTLGRDAGVAIDGATSAATVAYSAALTSRTTSFEIRESDGSIPAANARVVLLARPLPEAGTLVLPGQPARPLTGHARLSLSSAADGRVSANVPEAVYDLVMIPDAPGASGITATTIDLRPGRPDPGVLLLAPPAHVTGLAMDQDGAPLVGAHVSALPAGVLAAAGAPTVSTTTDADGRFSLALGQAASYQLVLDSRDGAHARERMAVVTPDAATLELAPWRARPAWPVRGQLRVTGQSGRPEGVIVQLACGACQGADARWIIAETISDAFGRFTLPVPPSE